MSRALVSKPLAAHSAAGDGSAARSHADLVPWVSVVPALLAGLGLAGVAARASVKVAAGLAAYAITESAFYAFQRWR